MAEKTNTQEQVKQILQRLDEGIQDLFTSKKYAEYLKTLSKFPQYSARNILLIHLQQPNATLVAGFRSWQEKFGRYVKRGEKGIKILAPTPFVQKMEMQKIDPITQEAVIGKDGLPVTEEVEIRIPRFRQVSVFDVSQTDGKPLPELAENLTGDVRHYDLFLETLQAASPLPISFHPFPENKDGECEYGVGIRIREGMSQPQTIAAILHEMAHARLHDPSLLEADTPRNSQTEELAAESIAYATAQYYGVETAPNSFGYIASWAENQDTKELHASFDIIQKTVMQFINNIDGKFHELAKERGIDLSIVTEPNVQTEAVNPELSDLQQKGLEIVRRCEKLPLQDRLNIIAQTFGCKTASITTSPCTGKWRGTSDVSIHFDNGNSLFIGNALTPKAKTLKVQNEFVNGTLSYYHPEIVRDAKELATTIMKKREAKDNAVAAQMGLKPYTFLNVELCDLADDPQGRHLGWYYATLAVEGRIIPFVETGFNYDIGRGTLSENFSEREYFVAGGLKDSDADFVFDNVGHSSFRDLYRVHLSESARERAENTLAERNVAREFEPPRTLEKEAELAAENILPDSSIGLAERDAFGYTDPAILPMRQERALELYDQDHTIYLLYQDGTEAMAFERSEVESHDGIFGIEADEWREATELRRMVSENSTITKEAIFLDGTEDAYAIYQIKDISSTSYAFLPLEQAGGDINCADYALVYSAPLPENAGLDVLYALHNSDDRPAAQEMRSLSLSDVIVLRYDGELSSHYVDAGGFSELPAFLGVETSSQLGKKLESVPEADSQLENNGPSVAELEATVKAGRQISMMDLTKAVKNEPPQTKKERPSVLAKLREAKMKLAQGANVAPTDQKRDTERGV